jgi:lysine 6-dehydrogenase
MRLIRALHEYGILSNPKVSVDGQRVGVLDAIAEHLLTSPEGTTTALYGYALHVEVTGTHQGRRIRHTLTHTHPPSDGSVPDWAGLRAYTRCVGIPLAIAVHLIAAGRATGVGVSSPEAALDPIDVFNALRERDIHIQHRFNPIG